MSAAHVSVFARQARRIGRTRRLVGRAAVVVVGALLLSTLAPQSGVARVGKGGWPAGWLRSVLALPAWSEPAQPATPKQETGTAKGRPHYVSADATRAKPRPGNPAKAHGPGSGAGELPAYRPHTPAVKSAKSQTSARRGRFDPQTSKRILSAASATSDIYQNADGSYTRKTFAGNVNYRAADGTWQPIDTRLARGSDGRLRAMANSLGIDFAGTADDRALASLKVDATHEVSYNLQGAVKRTPTVAGSAVTYPKVMPDTDLTLTSIGPGIKETLVLHSAKALTSWVFPLHLRGLVAQVEVDGSVAFRDPTGAVRATVPPGYMTDSKYDPHSGLPAESRAVKYRLITVDGGTALEVSADPVWVNDPARVFPIRVDPTVTEYPSASTFVDTINRGDNSGKYNLEVGTPDGGHEKAYSFLQFANFGDRYAQDAMSSAKLHVFAFWAYNCDRNRFDVNPVTQPWTPSGVKSYPGPAFRRTVGWTDQAAPTACKNGSGGGFHDPGVGDWLTFGIDPNLFTEWATGAPNYGLALTASQTNSAGWKQFDSTLSPNSPWLELTYTPDAAPQVDVQYPQDNYESPTLTPELIAAGHDPDNRPGGLQYQFTVNDADNNAVVTSGLVGSGDWIVPPGKLSWGKTYYWTAQTYDGYTYSDGNAAIWRALSTPVPQPMVTSGLSQNTGHGFEPSIGNYTTSAVDAQVVTVGPALSVQRDYNSADPRAAGAFGTGWWSLFDTKVTEQPDGSGAVATVTVSYPTGQEVTFGRNADGSFAAPLGRFATFKAMVGGGYSLTDKNGVAYAFTRALSSSGGYGITSVTDAAGRSEQFAYVAGRLATVTAASGRALHLTWQTPSGASTAHVATVATDPVTPGAPATALTWTYTYTGDQLATVCPPTSSTACTSYAYADNTQYPNAVLNAGPQSYWRLGEASGGTAASSVLANEGTDNAKYIQVTLGQPGPLPGSTATAAGFNGTSSAVQLPSGLVQNATYQSVSLWFRTSSTSTGTLFSTGHSTPGTPNPNGGAMPVLYVGNDGKLYGHYWNNNPVGIASPGKVNDGAWHHVVLTAGNNRQILYLDGAQVGTQSGQTYNVDPLELVGAGVYNNNGWPAAPAGNAWNYFAGSIADVAYFTQPVSGPTVAQMYAAGHRAAKVLSTVTTPSGNVYAQVSYDAVTGTVKQVVDENGGTWKVTAPTVAGSSDAYLSAVLAASPRDYWPLSDAPDADDAYSPINDALEATYNDVTLGVSGPFTDQTAASFDGSTSYLNLWSFQELPNNYYKRSISLWFNTTKAEGVLLGFQQDALDDRVHTTPRPYMPALYVGSDGRLLGTLGGSLSPIGTNKPVTDGSWHQVVLTTDGTTESMYLDGVLTDSQAVVGIYGPPYGSFAQVGTGFVGGIWPDQPHQSDTDDTGYQMSYTGTVANLAIFGSALTAKQVAQQWGAYKSSSGPTPVTSIRVTDPTGKTITYSYDALNGNRPVTYVDTLGNTTNYGYDTGGFLHVVVDPMGNQITTGHDVRGNVVSQSTCPGNATSDCSTVYYTYYPDDTSTTLSPDPRNDLLLTVRDGRSASATDNAYLTSMSYDAKGNRTAVTTPPVDGFPSGRTTTTAYTDGAQTPAADGGTAPAGLPAMITTPGGAKQTTTYYRSGDVAQTADPAGLVTGYTYDGLGRAATSTVVSDTYAAGLTSSYTYDGVGQVLTQTDPPVTNRVTGAVHTARTTTGYDDDGHLVSQTVADLTGGDAPRTTTDGYDNHGRLTSTTDPAGAVTTFDYDIYGNRTRQIDPAGNEAVSAYDSAGHLLTVTLKKYTGDPANPTAPMDLVESSRAYDPAGRLASVTDSMGDTTHYTYYDNGLLQEVWRDSPHAPRTFEVQYNEYDLAGHLIGRDANNGLTTTAYTVDAAGRTTSATLDPDGVARVTTYAYSADDAVLITTRSDASGASDVVDATYDPLGRVTSRTVHNGPALLKTAWALDRRGLPTAMTDPSGNVTSYSYDEAGRRAVTVAPTVNAETVGGSPVATHPTTMGGYDTFGAHTETSDPNGNVTTFGYDAAGRLVSTTMPLYAPLGASKPITAVAARTYNKLGQVATETDPLGNQTRYGYDQLGDIVATTAPDGGITRATFDTNGERLSVTDPTGAVSQATYDYLGRTVTATQLVRQPSPAADTTTYTYDDGHYVACPVPLPGCRIWIDGPGWLASEKSPAGVTTSYTYNGVGETTSNTDGAGNTSAYTYDFLGRRVSTTLPDGTRHTNTFDQAGRQTGSADLDAAGTVLRSRSAGYDNAGNMVSATDARGTTSTFSYDATGMVTGEVQPLSAGSSITTSFGYDAAGNRTRFTDGRGNPFITTYNSWNLPESTIEPATPTYPNIADRTFTAAYDADGDLVSRTEPGGVSVANTYDKTGRLTGQTGQGAEATTTARSFGYDLAGRMVSASAPGGADTFGYDDRGLLTSTGGPSGTSSFAYDNDGRMTSRTDAAGSSSYAYDTAGRLATVHDAATGTQISLTYNKLTQPATITYGAGGDVRTFGYDALHRLTSDKLTTNSGAAVAAITYGYDLNDNLTAKNTAGFAGSTANTYSYDLANRLTSWNNGSTTTPYNYDASGNRTSVGARTFSYDARNQLTSGGGATYTYTARGTLASVTAGAQATRSTSDAFDQTVTQGEQTYRYDALQRVATATGAGTVTLAYSGVGNTVASDGTTKYSRDPSDALIGVKAGSTGVLAFTDQHTDVVGQFAATGTALAGSVSYDPLGNVIAATNLTGNLGYQSGWTDRSTGRVNMAARWYNPDTGQFDSRDSVGLDAMPASVAANRFAYVDDNPLTGTDPSGHCGHWYDLVCQAKSAGRAIVHAANSTWNAITSTASALWDDLKAGASWLYHEATKLVDKIINTGSHIIHNTIHEIRDDYHRASNYVADKYEQARNYVAQKYERTKTFVEQRAERLKAQAVRYYKAEVHTLATAYHAAAHVVDAGVQFVEHHAATIASMVTSVLVFAGCEAVLGAVTAPAGGVGAVAGAAACGALAGAAGSAVGQGIKCHQSGGAACSGKSFAMSIGLGALGGAVGGAAAGAFGGQIASSILGDTASSLTRMGANALDGAITGGISGGAAGGATGAVAYAATCGSSCSLGGAAHAAAGGAAEGATTGAATGAAFSAIRPTGGCGHSFDPDTPVLLADGTSKPIKDIKTGDKVESADPATGKVTGQKVTQLHDNHDTDLADVSVANADGTVSMLHTTWNHPFWNASTRQWTEAKDLAAGSKLEGFNGTTRTVVVVRAWADQHEMRDLTVAATHTYYVLAGDMPILVHNCGGTVWDDIKGTQPEIPNTGGLPQSFELTAGETKVWVHGNATKHIAEYAEDMTSRGASPEMIGLGTQQSLRSLQAAVGEAGRSGLPIDQLVTIGGWELKFGAPRQDGLLPALVHARMVE